jgi:hypothetical protein
LNWGAVRAAERSFDARNFEQTFVQVIVPAVADAETDDMFESPGTISSGVFMVPGNFEHFLMNQGKFSVGGRVTDASGYFLAGAEWKDTFQKDRAYVIHQNTEYAVTSVDGSERADSILVTLKKK